MVLLLSINLVNHILIGLRLLLLTEGGSNTRMGGVESCFQNFFIPENLNKLSQVFGFGLHKCFMLETKGVVFTITLLGNKRLSTQNNTQVIRTTKNERNKRSHKEILY